MRFIQILSIVLILFSKNLSGQWINDSCHKASFICGSIHCFPAVAEDGSPQQIGPGYGCLTPYFPMYGSRWFYLKALTSGPVTLKITAPTVPMGMTTIPTIVWGGFSSPNSVCVGGLTASKIVFCIFAGITPSYVDFNVVAGQYYFINVVTSQQSPPQPYPIYIQQSNFSTPGHGTLDCSPLSGQECIMNFIISSAGICNLTSNTFTISGQVGYMYPPTTGYLLIKDMSSGKTDTILPPFNAVSSFSIEDVPCDNSPHYLTAWFTDGTCSIQDTITAPAGGCAVGTLWGGGTYCTPQGPPANVYISANGGQSPFSFSWSINGVPQPPVSGYSGGWPYQIPATAAGTYVLTSMDGKDCPGTYSGTAVVNIVASPQPVLNDTTVCRGSPVILDAGAGYTTYMWSTGAVSQSIVVNQSGTYTVTVSNSAGCVGSAQSTVGNLPIPAPQMIKHE